MFSLNNPKNILRLLFAMILGFGINLIPKCKISRNSGNIVKFRPPSFVFGIVWPILYILLGLSWILASKKINRIYVDIIFALLSVSLMLWTVVYSCLSNKKGGVYVLLLNILVLTIIIMLVPLKSQLMLVPLLIWLLFALLLNIFEVQG